MKYKKKQTWPRFMFKVFMVLTLGFLSIYLFLDLTNTIKWLGAPFLLIPDALGVIDRVRPEETHEFITSTRQSYEIALDKPGTYLIYLDAQGGFIIESDVTLSLSGPDGQVRIVPSGRGAKAYDTFLLHGFPAFRFTIEQPGTHLLNIRPNLNHQIVVIGIAPDYINGNTMLFAWAINLQVGLIVAVIGVVYYQRVYRPKTQREETIAVEQVKRRGDFEEFIEEYKHEQSQRKNGP